MLSRAEYAHVVAGEGMLLKEKKKELQKEQRKNK